MICLFDDTTELYVRSLFNKSDYSDVLTCYSDAILSGIQFDQTLLNADCILIHRSYPDNELFRYATTELSKWGKEKPLVVFSGEDEPIPVFKGDSCIKKMAKDKFYENLSAFLEYYRKNDNLELAVLAYGEKKDADYAVSKVKRILSGIKFLSDGDRLPINVVDLQDLKDLLVASAPEVGLSFEDLSSALSSNQYSVGVFRSNLVSIADSFVNYGKNVYHWRS